MAETDALDRLLAFAQAEGALGPERVAAFAQGLRERARLVLEARVQPLEQRVRDLAAAVAALEKENVWRRETASGLEAQVAWLKGREDGVRAELDRTRSEAEASRGELDGKRRETEGLRVELEEARRAAEILRTELDGTRSEADALRAELEGTRSEREGLRAARDQVAAALHESEAVHDRLLAHHRHVVDRAIRQFATAAALPFWKFRTCRTLMSEAAAQFARELA